MTDYRWYWVDCPKCNGTGKIEGVFKTCTHCDGRGQICKVDPPLPVIPTEKSICRYCSLVVTDDRNKPRCSYGVHEKISLDDIACFWIGIHYTDADKPENGVVGKLESLSRLGQQLTFGNTEE